MTYSISIVERSEQPVAVVVGHVPHDGIGPFVGSAFEAVLGAVGPAAVAGMPFARYDLEPSGFAVEAGFPVRSPIPPSEKVVPSILPAGTVAQTLHVGSYQGVAAAYAEVEAWMSAHGWTPAGAPWEEYLDGPEVAEPRTVVSWPCRAV